MPFGHSRDRSDPHMNSRSTSPDRKRYHERPRHKRSRTRSPVRDGERRQRQKRHWSGSPAIPVVILPYNSKPLSKRHYRTYEPLFQSYLDIQKQINLDDLEEREAKGRWKSFIRRWNRGELARSWYDPTMLESAQETVQTLQKKSSRRNVRTSPSYETCKTSDTDSDNDDFGPAPLHSSALRHPEHGPTVPRFEDIAIRDELKREERERELRDHVDDIRYERRQDRQVQKERLEELVPRADPGSRERQLEKKRETAGAVKGFRDAKDGGVVEIGDADLMGDEGMEGLKRKKVEQERQKTERELRREEIMRAKAAEREERSAQRRAKEAETMEYFKAIAKERFG